MGRAPCCDKGNVKRGPWSPDEDATLKSYIQLHGTGGNWIALPHKIGLKRCGKSCRLRWLNYLRPNIKHGGFSDEEDNIICTLYMTIGSRWSIIAAQLPGRTDNDIKNYWNTKLKKKLMSKQRKDVVSKQQAMINIENFMANSYKFWLPDDQLPASISSFVVNDIPANYQGPLNDPNQLVYDIDNSMNIYNIPNMASSLASVDNNATSLQVPNNYCRTDLEAFNNLVIDQLHEMAYGFMETSTNLCGVGNMMDSRCGSMNSTTTSAHSTGYQY